MSYILELELGWINKSLPADSTNIGRHNNTIVNMNSDMFDTKMNKLEKGSNHALLSNR